jgi:hypothetical protein
MGSDDWETEAYKKGQKKEQRKVAIKNIRTKAKAKAFITKKIINLAQIPKAQHWVADCEAEEMINELIKILNWKGEQVSSFYR